MAVKDIDDSTEFFKPKFGADLFQYLASGEMQGVHHIARYHWAVEALSQRTTGSIIDIACGSGYGSHMIAKRYPTADVLGVDYDPRAIEHARRNYKAANLRYVVGDVTTWTSEDGPLPTSDTIVSFDTIEHLLHRDIALMRMADNLIDDGWLLLATPCGHGQSRLNPAWEHHKCEYSHHDLFALLSRFFSSILQPQESDFPAGQFWRELNQERVLYLNRMNPVVCLGPIRAPMYRRYI